MEQSNSYLPEYNDTWLPSNNLQYPEGVSVSYKPFSFGDLLKINQSNLNEVGLYNFILEGITVKGMDKYDLTFYDVVYLGWRRKTASLGASMVDIKSFCPNCDFRNTKTLDLKALDFIDLEITALPMKLDISNTRLDFKFITIRDYIELLDKEQEKDIINLYAKSVENKSFEDAYNLIYSSTGDDLERIAVLDGLLYHGLKDIEFECKECKEKYLVKLTDSQEVEILKPFRGKETIIRDEISFG